MTSLPLIGTLLAKKPLPCVPSQYMPLLEFQRRTPGVEYLGDNVLLIPQDQKTDLVSEILPLLRGLPYRFPILKEKPKWRVRSGEVSGGSV